MDEYIKKYNRLVHLRKVLAPMSSDDKHYSQLLDEFRTIYSELNSLPQELKTKLIEELLTDVEPRYKYLEKHSYQNLEIMYKASEMKPQYETLKRGQF